jgi:hypothetical protein
MYIRLHLKYQLFLSDFNENLTSTTLSKNIEMRNFMKIRPVAAEFFHADGQTDMTKLTVACRIFVSPSKNVRKTAELC